MGIPYTQPYANQHEHVDVIAQTMITLRKLWLHTHLFYPARACAAGVKQCLHIRVCVCVRKKKKCFKQGRKSVYRRHIQRKTISIIILGRFCTWYKSRRFFTPLFQLFVAPPLSWSHVVVTVSTQLVPWCSAWFASHLSRWPIRIEVISFVMVSVELQLAESIWQRTEGRAG